MRAQSKLISSTDASIQYSTCNNFPLVSHFWANFGKDGHEPQKAKGNFNKLCYSLFHSWGSKRITRSQ